jgi:sodium transport system permease protein
LLWAIFNGIAFVRGQAADLTARVVIIDATARPELNQRLAQDARVQLVPTPLDEREAGLRIRHGELDAALVVSGEPGAAAHDFRARLLFDGSRDRSVAARDRVGGIVGAYRDAIARESALADGVSPEKWIAFALEERNAASGRDMGAFVLGLLLPLFFVVMVALGCLNPAIDATAGERERNTWETLMTTAASRGSIVAAKYLAVTTFGGVAGLLNILAMLATVRGTLAPLLARGAGDGIEFSLSAFSMLMLICAALLLSGLLAAGMMVVASFARTFREGQSMVTPLYAAAVFPALSLSSPGIRLTAENALIPVVNIALVVREALAGSLELLELSIAAAATLLTIGACIKLATVILSVEDVVVGSYSGSVLTFVRRRVKSWAGGTAR